MTIVEFEKVLQKGESIDTEFKSWVKASSMKERVALAVDELIAFANSKGGTVYFGVEDNGEVTGCTGNYDLQNIVEAIYDKTRPPLFTEAGEFEYKGKTVISLSVEHDGTTYATTDGRCLRRLGKNSKPYYPDEMSNKYSAVQNPDFSGQIIVESTEDDINKLEIYKLKEKLKARDPESTLSEMEDMTFLSDLGLIKYDAGNLKLTIVGLLFVGKEQAIHRMLPQAEVIYLHYSQSNLEEYDARLDMTAPIISVIDRLSEKIQDANRIVNVQVGLFRLEIVDFSERVFQEALLNALAHRDYQNQAAVYVKHYPDKIVIENPGGFPEGITEHNIITHPSVPRNKLIAETLQRLKYVQRTGQGVDIIFRDMVSSGKPYPEYRAYNDAVSLSIYSAIDDVEFVKFVARASFGGVIGNLTSSVKKVIHKGLSVIQGIVHRLFQFTSAGWIECIQPGPEFVPDRRFFFLAFLFPLLSREILIKTFQIEQPVAERNSLLSRKQRRISSCASLWLLDLLLCRKR